jgi:enamine deaminase RidA (YjgF/YER057c/UK114 family)
MERQFINPPGSLDSIPRGYTHVVRVNQPGSLVYVAGQGPVDTDLQLIGAGDFEAQVRATFENIKRGLEQAGASFNDVVKMNVFVTDIKSQQWPFRNVRAEYINTVNPPVSTMVEVSRLAIDGMMVEVEVVAVLP